MPPTSAPPTCLRLRRGRLRMGAAFLPDAIEALFLLALVVAIVAQLFVDPVVGVADNRDFARLMDPAGLDYRSVADYRETVFAFVETKFAVVEPRSYRYLTSARPILAVAKAANHLLSGDGHFDLRYLGLCNAMLYIAATWAFLRAFRTRPIAIRLFVAVTLWLMCSDVAWVAYFNSFYSESASLIFLFATVGAALLCIQHQRPDTIAWVLYLAYLASAFLFWMAKSQNAAFAPCLAVGAWFCFPVSALRARTALRAVGAVAFPVAVAWAFAAGAYGVSVPTNAKVVLTEEILPHSVTPLEDLRELRVEQGGLGIWRIAAFYLRHPGRWWEMAQRQARDVFTDLPYGNFTRASGFPPKTRSHSFNLWSRCKNACYPRSLGVLIGLFLAYCVLSIMKAAWLDKNRAARATTLAGPILALGLLLELVVVVTFEANGTAKHLFIFNVGVDICLLLSMVALAEVYANGWLAKLRGLEPAGDQPLK